MNRVASRVKPLVTTQWLANKLPLKGSPSPAPSSSSLRVIDASTFDALDGKEQFSEKHIPTAQFFNIKECRDTNSSYPAMLPNPRVFEDYVGNLGISNQTHVVVYDQSRIGGVHSAPRAWWMLRYFGHDSVSVLNGGLARWIDDGLEVTREIEKVAPQIFKAQPRKELLKHFEDIEENAKKEGNALPLTDARGPAKFKDHIKGAVNIYHSLLHSEEKSEFKSEDGIREAFKKNGVNIEKPFIATCNSGVTACTLAFGAYLCGNEDIPVYDGSWQEWHKRAQESMIVSLKE